ncbi:MAG: hypothetical protein GXO26_01635 [Crenarchaeota archaeon]|nr:hypothetical protein [Thermoproteota archaeon]
MRPLTLITPKPLVPLSKRWSSLLVLLDSIEKLLRENERIFLIFGYCCEPYYRYLKYRNVNVIVDERLRGTAGQLRPLIDNFNISDALILNGDLLISDKCLREIFNRSRESRSKFIIFLLKRKFKYGVIDLSGKTPRWIEKPSFLTVTGIYKVDMSLMKKILEEIGKDHVDMNEVVTYLHESGIDVEYVCLNCDEDDIIDIGTPLDFVKSLTLLNKDDIYVTSAR